MGLDIHNYHAGYSQLHRLRQWALSVEKNPKKLQCVNYGKLENCGQCVYCALDLTKNWEEVKKITRFPEFINHSDCDGGYIALERLGLEIKDEGRFRDQVYWGDLDELKKEIRELSKHEKLLNESNKISWDSFKEDILGEDIMIQFG